MAEYIDREAAVDAVADIYYDTPEINLTAEKFEAAINGIPAADVAPVVHGRWEVSTDEWFETDVYTCSKCRESYVLVEGTPKENLWHYCPNCGAKMDGNWKQTT